MIRFCSLAVFFLAAALLSGCGPSTSTVSGTVTYQGKKVVWGGVALVAADGTAHPGTIEKDGSFTIANVPTGTAKVGVTSPDPLMGAKSAKEFEGTRYKPPQLPAGAWFPVPEKFGDPKTSGLTVEVGSGAKAEIDVK